jgi:lipid A 4'-phosphatase
MGRAFWIVVAAIIVAGVVFAVWPQLDLAVAHSFYDHGGFIGAGRLAKAARAFFSDAPFYVLAAFILAYALARWGKPAAFRLAETASRGGPAAAIAGPLARAIRWCGERLRWAPDGRVVVFLIATLIVGPGLIVNLGLKDHAHRPRPVQVVEFGGADAFRPWDRFDGACVKNCSFVSGEASSGFWMVAPALAAPPPWRAPALVGAVAFGVGASVLRLAFGGHFLSDVLLGGLISVLVILVARRLLWPKGGP